MTLLTRKLTRAAALALILILTAFPLEAVCETEIIVLFDVSGSTESMAPVLSFIDTLFNFRASMATSSGGAVMSADVAYTWKFIPFEKVVGGSCDQMNTQPLDGSDPVAVKTRYSDCFAAADKDSTLETRSTDITKVLERIDLISAQGIAIGKRRLFMVFSDMRHSVSEDQIRNSEDWLQRHKNHLSRVKYNLERIKGHKLIFSLQKTRGGQNNADFAIPNQELVDIANALSKDFKAQAVASNAGRGARGLYEWLVLDEVVTDSVPIEVALQSITARSVKVEVFNPGCFEYRSFRYELRDGRGVALPLDASPSPLLERPANCKDLKDRKWECSFDLPDAGSTCKDKYSVRVVPEGNAAAADETEVIAINNCFSLRSVEFDIADRLDGAPHFQRCNQVHKNSENDEWRQWEDADLGTVDHDEVKFLACVEASGSLGKHEGKFTLKETPASNESIQMRSVEVNMDRFMAPLRPDQPRFFPLFFKLSRDEARRLCYDTHDEPIFLYLDYEIHKSGSGLSIKKGEKALLRNKNRESEDNLHDLWESILVPVGLILILIALALWTQRHGTQGVVEELLAVIGFGLATLAAGLHDASRLGDMAEEVFATFSLFLSVAGILFLFAFFMGLLLSGVLEPQTQAEAGVRIVLNASLMDRRRSFKRRILAWIWIMIVLAGSGMASVVLMPKEIDSCHYTGIAGIREEGDSSK